MLLDDAFRLRTEEFKRKPERVDADGWGWREDREGL